MTAIGVTTCLACGKPVPPRKKGGGRSRETCDGDCRRVYESGCMWFGHAVLDVANGRMALEAALAACEVRLPPAARPKALLILSAVAASVGHISAENPVFAPAATAAAE